MVLYNLPKAQFTAQYLDATRLERQGRLTLAKGMLPLVHADCHGSQCVMPTMEIEQFAVADVGQHITIGNQERGIGTPRDLYSAPQTRFVASFIGAPAMNFLPVRLIDDVAELPGGFHLPIGRHLGIRTAELGIRPEHLIQLAPGAPGLAVRVELVELLGADMLVTARLEKQLIVARLSGETNVAPGEALMLGIDAARAHLFDPSTGHRL